jgi:RAD51-like protein 1
LANISLSDAQAAIHRASLKCQPKRVSCSDLLRLNSSVSMALTTGLPHLDAALKGGIPVGSISEIVGAAGVGKTQFSLMMAVRSTLPCVAGGLAGNVLYLDTEGSFSPERMLEIAKSAHPAYFSSPKELLTLSRSVFVKRITSIASLEAELQSCTSFVVAGSFKLIIVDSIAALFGVGDQVQWKDSIAVLGRVAGHLKLLADSCQLVVLVTNHITRQYQHDDIADLSSLVPALGISWAHFVNHRLVCQDDGSVRKMTLAKSALAPVMSLLYKVELSGLVEEHDEVIK